MLLWQTPNVKSPQAQQVPRNQHPLHLVGPFSPNHRIHSCDQLIARSHADIRDYSLTSRHQNSILGPEPARGA